MMKGVDNPVFFSEYKSGIICRLCSQYCRLRKGQTGVCGVNQNVNGSLRNLVYGHPIAVHSDPIEKKPLYHFLPGSTSLSLGTLGCNMQCPFCQNWHISQQSNISKTQNFVSSEEIVSAALKNNCKSISYTYNEPTVFYPYARDIAIEAKKSALKNVFVTNGIASSEVITDMAELIDACNVDLKSSEKSFYKKLLKAPFTVLESLKLMKKLGIWVEITTLIVPDENDSVSIFEEISNFIAVEMGVETPWHISAFHPDFKMLDKTRTSQRSLVNAFETGMKKGLKYIYIGNSSFQNNTVCPDCGYAVLERVGYMTYNNYKIPGICPDCNFKIKGIWE
jgi:pyruvate formate lyase activating enzyme